MKRTVLFILLAVCLASGLAAQEFPLRQAFDLRWDGFHQRTADNCELVFFTDTPAGHRDIFAQKLGPDGQALWAEPLPVASHAGDQKIWAVAPSSDNNFILLWGEYYINNCLQLRAQKISSSGQRLWADEGIQIGGYEMNIRSASLVPNTTGGAFVLFQEWFEQSLRGQNLDAWGNQLWTLNGIELASHNNNMELDSAVPDGEGGIIINVSKSTNQNSVSELTRYSPQGTVVGPNPLIPVGLMPNFSKYSIMQSTGGTYILYYFGYSPNCGLWQRRIDNLGVPTAPYTEVASLQLKQSYSNPPVLAPLADGGTMVCYEALPADGCAMFALRFDANFGLAWTYPGIAFASGMNEIWMELDLAPTPECGAWVSWTELLNDSGADVVKSQYIAPSGSLPWGADGIVLSNQGSYNRLPLTAAYSDRGMFAWFDRIEGMDSIQRQVVSTGGALYLGQGGGPISERIAGRANNAGCYAIGNRFCSVWTDYRQSMQICYQVSDLDMQPLFGTAGEELNPPFDGYEIFLEAQETPWNTLAILYGQMYNDYSATNYYLQEVDASGIRLYPAQGIFLGTDMDLSNHRMGIQDGSIYLGWLDNDGNGQVELCGQRIAGGQAAWGAEGKVLASWPGGNTYTSLEGVWGSYYLWRVEDYNQNLVQCKALKVDSAGDPAPGWESNGLSIVDETGYYNQGVQSAGLQAGDLIVFIRLSQAGSYQIRAQKISTAGQRLWLDSGMEAVPGNQNGWIQDVYVGQEIGYAYTVTVNEVNKLQFQKINSSGQLMLPEPSLLGDNMHNCYDAQLERFADGSWFCAWTDTDGMLIENRNAFVRQLTPQGVPLGAAPVVFCGERFQQDYAKIAQIGNLALVTWADDRAGIHDNETAYTGIWGRPFISNYVDVDDPADSAPHTPVLNANYPNPFNPSTTISFNLPEAGNACLEIFNLKGQRVKQLLPASSLPAGEHKAVWDGRDDCGQPVSSGVYLYRLRFQDGSICRKMLLAK